VSAVHTYPIDDVVEHDTESFDCICCPTIEPPKVWGDDYLVIHNSFDGRELEEAENA